MRPPYWHPPIELSALEEKIVQRIKRAKLFVFLRQERHQLFNEEFQEELALMYADSRKGHPPVPPAQLALTIILQAYTGASDAEAIEALTMDRRWQIVIDCLDCEQAPFCQATKRQISGGSAHSPTRPEINRTHSRISATDQKIWCKTITSGSGFKSVMGSS